MAKSFIRVETKEEIGIGGVDTGEVIVPVANIHSVRHGNFASGSDDKKNIGSEYWLAIETPTDYRTVQLTEKGYNELKSELGI